MRKGEIGWMAFLSSLPFAHLLLFRTISVWHAQTLWAEAGVLTLWGWSLMRGGALAPQRALGVWVVWSGWSVLMFFYQLNRLHHQYPVERLMGAFHLVFLVWFLHAACAMWDQQSLPRLLSAMGWAGVVVLGYCGLQALNLDQFYRNLHGGRDVVMGTLGNPSHLGSYLAFLMPIFLWWGRWKGWVCAGIASLLLISTDSQAAWLSAAIATLWWGWWTHRKMAWGLLGIMILAAMLCWWKAPHVVESNGRFLAWRDFWEVLQVARPITGVGIGWIREWSATLPTGTRLQGWGHVHNEFFQLAIEQGVIGMGLVGWMVWEWGQRVWRVPKTPLVVSLSGIGLAVLSNSLLSYPMHLWVLGVFGLVAYAGIMVLDTSEA